MQVLQDEDTAEEHLKAQVAEIKEQFHDKAENVGKIILSLVADTQTIKDEEIRLTNRRVKLERKVDWLKSYLQQEMTVTGIDKIEGKILTISLRANPPSVKVINENDIPAEFRRIIPETWQVDKTGILKHFKDTGEIPFGTEVVTGKKTLVIK